LTDLIMAQNKETRLWQQLKNLDKDWHFTRVESSTVNGIPDVHCVVNKQVFWLELKANTSKNCGLSKYQINWHIKYLKAGGKAYILNRPLLQAPYELLAVSRESRTAVPLSRHTDLKTLITFASQLGPRGSSREA
jgi:Holliday junction resolvase